MLHLSKTESTEHHGRVLDEQNKYVFLFGCDETNRKKNDSGAGKRV